METSVWKRKINILLLGIPLVLLRDYLPLGEGAEQLKIIIVFICSALSLIPLAGFLESAVEELAELLGDVIGGLLHTTATNIAELTLSLSILLTFSSEKGSGAEVVEGTIAGVIIRNSLLFLGIATFIGCLRNGRMKFSRDIASDFSTVFALAVTGLSLPTLAFYISTTAQGSEGGEGEAAPLGLTIAGHFAPFALCLAVVLLISYLAYIIFSVFRFRADENLQEKARLKKALKQRRREQRRNGHVEHDGENAEPSSSHVGLAYQPDTQALFSEERASAEARLSGAPARPRHGRAKLREERRRAMAENGEEVETGFLAGHRVLRGLVALGLLAVATGFVALMSEGFADSVEELLSSNEALLSQYEFFLGLILIPLLAGMVELYGSVGMARRKRMDITMEITAGATIQMILFVVPVLVIVGFLTGHPLTLTFNPLEIIIFGAATFAFMLLSRDGESTILEGVQLSTLWLLFAVIAIFLPPLPLG